MNIRPLLLLPLLLASSSASDLPRLVDPALQVRAGVDTNPAATHGTTARVVGGADAATFAAGASFGLAWGEPGTLKLTYAGETVRFDGWEDEDYSTHRLGLSARVADGPRSTTLEASSLFVDGSRATLPSLSSANANAVALWRERRRQWQHRAKLQSQTEIGPWLVRGGGTFLACDYHTRVVAGDVPFADRSDLQGFLDLGRRPAPDSLWFASLRAGRQDQAIVPLPNCEFDYSNRYTRLALGWEGKLLPHTTLAFVAGPDFRRYDGAVDSRVFPDRDRTSLWFEGSLTAKPAPALTLSARTARFEWLSSTGKSAYRDTTAEGNLAWAATPRWTARLTARLHRCEYYPAARDDWESFLGAGLTHPLSACGTLALDLLWHRGWNGLEALPERDFHRFVLALHSTWKL